MPSPFPGMNPYLEQDDLWRDFHQRFIARAADFLVPQVRPEFIVGIETSVYLHERSSDDRHLHGGPDVFVTRASPDPHALEKPAIPRISSGSVKATVPLLAVEEIEDSYIEIRDRRSRQVVTLIELLSPSNKRPGDDRAQYIAKRIRSLRSRANFVDIDLLRGGPRMLVDGLPPCDYYTMVSRAEVRPQVDVWPIMLRQPIPPVPIPLTADKPDATLDIQQVLHQVYDAAGYGDYIYINAAIRPPLTKDDQLWAAQCAGI